jgi:uncharacterized SAM-dependent methyltransferase
MYLPSIEKREFARAVALGLSDLPRWLPCRYLYDAAGNRLFERITQTPEYYLTRTETTLLDNSADAIARLTGNRTLVELGAGNARKTERVLTAQCKTLPDATPADVSGDAPPRSAKRRPGDSRPSRSGVHGTYETAFPLLPSPSPPCRSVARLET